MKPAQSLYRVSCILLLMTLFSGAMSAQTTTVYFDLKKPGAPCEVQQSDGAKQGEVIPKAQARPNPFTHQVSIEGNVKMTAIAIHDISGRLIRTIDQEVAERIELNTGNLANGIYFFVIDFETGAKTTLKLCKTL